MAVGIALILGGLLLAAVPLSAARLANTLRFVPYSTEPTRVRSYRLAGGILILVGVLAAVLL